MNVPILWGSSVVVMAKFQARRLVMMADESIRGDELCRTAEAKRLLGGCGDEKIAELVASGHLRVVHLPGAGRYRRFRRSDLDRLIFGQEAVMT
jgi:excisionase family DNA binding protein